MNEPTHLPSVYWVTRDMLGGVLSSKVEIWAVRPHREVSEDGDVLWFPPLEMIDGPDVVCLGEWSLARCQIQIRVIPDDSLQCLVVGREAPVEFISRNVKALS